MNPVQRQRHLLNARLQIDLANQCAARAFESLATAGGEKNLTYKLSSACNTLHDLSSATLQACQEAAQLALKWRLDHPDGSDRLDNLLPWELPPDHPLYEPPF